jgi:hypothetical protein
MKNIETEGTPELDPGEWEQEPALSREASQALSQSVRRREAEGKVGAKQ